MICAEGWLGCGELPMEIWKNGWGWWFLQSWISNSDFTVGLAGMFFFFFFFPISLCELKQSEMVDKGFFFFRCGARGGGAQYWNVQKGCDVMQHCCQTSSWQYPRSLHLPFAFIVAWVGLSRGRVVCSALTRRSEIYLNVDRTEHLF